MLDPKEARIIELVRRSPATARGNGPKCWRSSGQWPVSVQGRPGTSTDIVVRREEQFERKTVAFAKARPIRIDNGRRPRLFEEAKALCRAGSGIPWADADIRRDAALRHRCTPDIVEHIDTQPFRGSPCWSARNACFL